MSRLTAVLCSMAFLLFTGTAQAERYAGTTVYAQGWYVVGMGGYLHYDDSRNVDEDVETWGFGAGYQFNSRYGAELVYARQDTRTDVGNLDADAKVWRLDVIRNFRPRGRTTPFLLFGVGDMDLANRNLGDGGDETFVNLGAGFRYRISDRWSLRWDVRTIRSIDEQASETSTNLALIYALNDAYKAAEDREAFQFAPVAADGGPGDADGDGVLDDVDQCPDTPRNLRVNKRGCPILTREGVQIDLNVEFDFDKDVVKTQYYPRIEAVADFMKKYPTTNATLEGHTDSIGPDAYNQGLSDRRANAVRRVFIEKYGIDGKRLQAIGYGESKPIADNKTDEGRQRNRRVTAVIKTTRSWYKQR